MQKGQYNKDLKVKFQVKFLHDYYAFPLPFIAAIQGTTRKAAHYRYETITNEIKVYADTKELYQQYVDNILSVKTPILASSDKGAL